MRYTIELAYNGANFHGWQKQLNARSVQQELEEKLFILLKKPIDTLGCGRTDTGVHAKQFIAHFDFEELLDSDLLVYKLNRITSKDIAIKNIVSVHDSFNARFDAKWREYEYVIATKPNPFLNEFSWYNPSAVNIDLMNQACQLLLTHTNFECFSKVHTQVNNFNCNLMEAYWKQDGELLVFTIKANRFLRNMVRAIVGTLIQVGLRNIDLTHLAQILASKNRSEAGMSVPAHGLFLTKVVY
ncbi:MAG: tRNA pseudouridine(38-40) synthase TruA [Bacteroidia bacterium]|jgi:tRNA pseudouridine38-40 synthase|nr:tRNA pseudouridine(38-40) synthase TruA [Bacteroidia bacterium]